MPRKKAGRAVVNAITVRRGGDVAGSGRPERWRVEVIHLPQWGHYEVWAHLEAIEVPDTWDDWRLVPAHEETIPGACFQCAYKILPRGVEHYFPTLGLARRGACQTACTLAGRINENGDLQVLTIEGCPKIEAHSEPKTYFARTG